MTEHVDGSLALLQYDVTDQRLIFTVGRTSAGALRIKG